MRVRVPRPAPGQVWPGIDKVKIAGWSSQEARRAHNPKVAGSNPAPATNFGGIAQMARARGSYPRCHWFDSSCRHQKRIRLRPIKSKNRSKERIFLFLTRFICPCQKPPGRQPMRIGASVARYGVTLCEFALFVIGITWGLRISGMLAL